MDKSQIAREQVAFCPKINFYTFPVLVGKDPRWESQEFYGGMQSGQPLHGTSIVVSTSRPIIPRPPHDEHAVVVQPLLSFMATLPDPWQGEHGSQWTIVLVSFTHPDPPQLISWVPFC
jgi:hypothetical protein